MDSFLKATQFIGSRFPFWVQGPGGNTSMKFDEGGKRSLLIKSTGLRLDQVSQKAGLSKLNLENCDRIYTASFLKQATENDYSKFIKSEQNLEVFQGVKNLPSMETGFHISLKKKYVFHFHSLVSQLIYELYRVDQLRVVNWFKANSQFLVHFVDFCSPGLSLSRTIGENPHFDIYFLESHGVILQLDQAEQLDDYIQLENLFCEAFGQTKMYSYFKKDFRQILEEFQNTLMPFKSYFPDTLVFKTEIEKKVLEECGGGQFRLRKTETGLNQDLLEIWLATLILYSTNAGLKSLSSELADSLQNMPSEITRRNKLESKV